MFYNSIANWLLWRHKNWNKNIINVATNQQIIRRCASTAVIPPRKLHGLIRRPVLGVGRARTRCLVRTVVRRLAEFAAVKRVRWHRKSIINRRKSHLLLNFHSQLFPAPFNEVINIIEFGRRQQVEVFISKRNRFFLFRNLIFLICILMIFFLNYQFDVAVVRVVLTLICC